jgi:Flp pilus assembly pilin Flp
MREGGTLLVREPQEDEMNSVLRIATREDGQDLLEYGILASLIAIFALSAVRLLANQITSVFWGAIATKF